MLHMKFLELSPAEPRPYKMESNSRMPFGLLTTAYPIVFFHVSCHVTLRLIAIFGKRDFTSFSIRLREKQERS